MLANMGKSRTGLASLIAVVALSLSGCAGTATAGIDGPSPTPTAEEQQTPAVKEASIRCGVQWEAELLDDGTAIQLEGVAKNFNSALQMSHVECLLTRLEAPETILGKIGQTRALDGRQSDEWDGFEIEWNYHPDDGASIIIAQTE